MPRFANYILLTAIVLLAPALHAASVGDYQNRLGSARAGVQTLLDNVAAEEAGEPIEEPNAEVFAAVKELIPPSERIEAESGTIETSNQWFAERLDAAEKETDLTKRAQILTELNERLAAVSLKLDELRNAAAAERSKDEDKRKLAEILNREEYQKPVQQRENPLAEWIRRFFEWLETWFPKFNPGGSLSGIGSAITVLQWVLIGLIVAAVGFLIYKLAPLLAPRFRRRAKDEKPERVILGERIDEDMSSADLFGEAERLAREGDARGAIRKGYIALLCELSDRKLIGLARHKTNRDYLRDLRPKREVEARVGGLTGDFERHWYGEQSAAVGDWEEFRRRCGDAIKAI